MTFRDRIVVREIAIRALLCGRRPFEALMREVDVRALVRMLQNRP
jgi:methylglyoxal synthase